METLVSFLRTKTDSFILFYRYFLRTYCGPGTALHTKDTQRLRQIKSFSISVVGRHEWSFMTAIKLWERETSWPGDPVLNGVCAAGRARHNAKPQGALGWCLCFELQRDQCGRRARRGGTASCEAEKQAVAWILIWGWWKSPEGFKPSSDFILKQEVGWGVCGDTAGLTD